MRQITLIFGLLIALAACDSVAQFKEPIMNLAANWETATAQVTEFAENLNNQKQQFQSTLSGMQLSEEMKGKLSEEVMGKVNTLQQQYAGYGETFNNLSNQVEAFVSNWQEKGETLNTLQEGLENGSLPADAQAQIASLKDLVQSAGPTVEEWQGKLEEATQGAGQVAEQYQALIDEHLPTAKEEEVQ